MDSNSPLNYFNPINKNDNYNSATEIDTIIKQLKNDAYQLLQNQSSSLLLNKVQHLKYKIEKIEEKIKNKITSIDNIVFYLFDTLNKIYSHLYDYHRNSNLNNDVMVPMSMSNVNDELILLCRAAFRIYNKYLVYDSQCLNMMINQILNLGSLTINEKLYQEFSKPDYERFINKFANSQQRDKFSEKKLLLERELKSVQTHILIPKENELKSPEKSDKTNNEKINKTEESNTILLEEVIKILKNDLALIMQNPADSIRIDKIQNLYINLEKIEISLNKSSSIKFIASLLFTDLNLIYYELYEHYRNSTITVYKKNSPEKTPISFNSKLDELCRLGIKLLSKYLTDEPRSLNSMINIIVNFHLRLNLDEKSMEDFSQNSLPEYEHFIEKFGNSEKKEKFAKLKKKFLFTSEINNGKNNQLPNNVSIEKKSSQENKAEEDKECSAKAQSNRQASNQKRSSGDIVYCKNDGTPYVDHTTRAPFRNNHIDFKTLKERATSSVLHNKYETFDDRFLLSYLDLILATIIDEFMFIEKHFIKFSIIVSIIVVSRKELEEIQIKFFDYGKFKIDDIKKILNCLIKSYYEIHRPYTIILYDNRCPESTINHLASAMTLFCEMMIEIYEVFQNRLDKPYDIINLINNKQIHLKKLKNKANFYSKWLDYYHEFVLKYGNKKQKKDIKKDITDVLNLHFSL